MKSLRNNAGILACVFVFTLAALLLLTSSPSPLSAQDPTKNFNPPPFDFNDAFYTANGISVAQLDAPAAGRFGLFRLTGPPAGPGQVNWVVDNSNTDPDRNNIRILATTGGYKDDTGAPTEFISIIAFLLNQNFFTGVANKRGIQMVDIVNSFEAYAGLKQVDANGVFQFQPCLPSKGITTNCFSVASVATPNLRQDWRFATNRNAIDGSSPFGYFCDDILGMWIITYFFYTAHGFGPAQTPKCAGDLAALAATNGLSLDGTPIIKTGDQLNSLEGDGFAGEINLDPGGADVGAVWLVCPAIPDPRNGGIAKDAFADVVRKSDGSPLDPAISNNFTCLQTTGLFCNGQ